MLISQHFEEKRTLMKTLLTLLSVLFFCSLNTHANEPLPVSAFASLPDVKGMKLSPNGKLIASMVNSNAEDLAGTVVSILNVETGEKVYPVYTDNEKFVLNWIRWASDKKLLMSARYPAIRYGLPTTETRLLMVDMETFESGSVIRTSYIRGMDWIPQFQDNIIDILPNDEDSILLALSDDRPTSSNVYSFNLETRRRTEISRNRGKAIDWITDRQNNLRVGIDFDETTYTVIHRPVGEKKWATLWKFEAFSLDQVWPLGFDEDSNILFVRAYHQDKLAIFKVDLSNLVLERELIYSDPNYDVDGSLIYSNLNNKVVGITYSSEGGFTFWEDSYKGLQEGLNKVLPDTENVIVDFSKDEQRYLLLTTSDTNPGTYFYGDRENKTLIPIAYRYLELQPENMVDKEYISYKARDGLDISAYLSLPFSSGEQPLPTIIFPHGGPISYDDGGFDYWTQFFANRGYAVLQMNFRGSSGYGYDFMQSGLQNWGLEMQNDVEDGTRWLIEQGIADPERICVVGASYGGYAALMEAARNSDLYQCAVSFAGVTDVASLVKSKRGYTSFEIAKEQIGSDYRELRARSPINLVEQIDIPVLLVHGTKDRSVNVSHSKKMYSALNRKDKEVTYIEQDDGDHYLSNEIHRLQLFNAMDEFLQTHLH